MKLRQAKAILFDLDDTLIDHQGALNLAIKDVYDTRQELKAAFPLAGVAPERISTEAYFNYNVRPSPEAVERTARRFGSEA